MYLFDSDVARKLAQYRMLTEFTTAYKCTLGEIAVLPELKFQLKLSDKSKAVKILGSEECYDEVSKLLEEANEAVPVDSDKANEILAMNHSNLDIGEQTLLAVLVSDTSNILISGDKRAFIAISQIEEQIIVNLWSNMVCLEEAILNIVHSNEFSVISTKVRSRPDVDSALKIAFGVSQASSIESVIDALSSFIGNLIKDTNSLYSMKT